MANVSVHQDSTMKCKVFKLTASLQGKSTVLDLDEFWGDLGGNLGNDFGGLGVTLDIFQILLNYVNLGLELCTLI